MKQLFLTNITNHAVLESEEKNHLCVNDCGEFGGICGTKNGILWEASLEECFAANRINIIGCREGEWITLQQDNVVKTFELFEGFEGSSYLSDHINFNHVLLEKKKRKKIKNVNRDIRNCSNCRCKKLWSAQCGWVYACDQHKFNTFHKPFVGILNNDPEKSDLKEKLFMQQVINANVLPLNTSLYLPTFLNGNNQALSLELGNEMLTMCDALWVSGILTETSKEKIDHTINSGVPVYLLDEEKVLPDSPMIKDVIKDIKKAHHTNKYNEELVLVYHEEFEEVLQICYYTGNEYYKVPGTDQHLLALSDIESNFLYHYAEFVLNCTICDCDWFDIEPKIMDILKSRRRK